MMFDTLRAAVSGLALSDGRLLERGFQRVNTTKLDGEGELSGSVRFQSMRKNEHPHYLAYIPASGTLVAETSLPKMWHKSNVRLLSSADVPAALDEFSNRVWDVCGGSVPHLRSWDVRGRLDACYSWNVVDGDKNYVTDYLAALKNVSLARHYSSNVDKDRTLYWRNGSRVIRFYDKEKESRDERARGLLRFEVELKRAKGEMGFTGGELKVGDALRWDNARGIMDKYLTGLHTDLVITDERKLFDRLVGVYGLARARRLYGSLKMLELYDEGELSRKFGVERTMVWRDRRDIQGAGLNTALIDSGVLPPLMLPSNYDGEPQFVFA